MDNEKMPKNAKIYTCEKCDFKCSKLSNYETHLATDKHRRITLDTLPSSNNNFTCSCGNVYKYASGLSKHRKKCSFSKSVEKMPKDNSQTEMMKNFMKENREMMVSMVQTMVSANKEMVVDLVPKLQPNVTNNTQNNNFNINMFLNEQCKDAINLSDFIDRIEVSHDDLENNAQLGFVDGITKILRDNLQQLTIKQRPIHCTDTKRETLYIKDADKWQKEAVKEKLNSAIQDISRKSVSTLLDWKKINPEYDDIDSEFSNKCIKMQQNSMAGDKTKVYYPKITHYLAKDNLLNKQIIQDLQKDS